MSENPKIPVLSLSGGMDSSALLLHVIAGFAEEPVYAVSFNYGQRHSLELERLDKNLELLRSKGFKIHHTLIDLQGIGNLFYSSLTTAGWNPPEGHYAEESMKETVVPNRNAIFSSVIYGYALSIAQRENREAVICLGVHSGDHAVYPDCRPEFYDSIGKSFALGNWDAEKVSFYLPYLEGDKESILRDAYNSCLQLSVDFDQYFKNTNTSYDPDEAGRASGKTGSDIERILAFNALGVKDPVEYQEPWNVVVERALEMEKKHQND